MFPQEDTSSTSLGSLEATLVFDTRSWSAPHDGVFFSEPDALEEGDRAEEEFPRF